MQLKILSLGDEFTVSAGRYLAKTAKSDDVTIVSGCMMLSDSSLENHLKMITDDIPVYRFEYNGEGSVRLNEMDDVSASKIFDWFDWDYIIIQQSMDKAGVSESYNPYIREIADLIRQKCPRSEIIINEPWAFEDDSAEPVFELFDNNTQTMAEKIRTACINASVAGNIKIVFPTGEAWNNARKENFCRLTSEDGCHASRCGEFLSSALWYEILTGNDIRKNSYRLPFVESNITTMLKDIAHETAEKYSLHK